MKLQILAACAALVSLSAGSAFAGDAVTAKLQAPVAQNVKFIAGGAIFKCEGDTCIALAPTSSTFATDTCRTIAEKVGPVTAFTGAGVKTLAEAKLADCNAKAVAKIDATKLAKQ